MENDGKKIGASSRKSGCLISILIACAVLAWILWQIGEPGRRARRVHGAIRPGMAYEDVEDLLMGRHYCFFQVRTNDQWRSLSKPNFTLSLAGAPTNSPAAMRLKLHFIGLAPRRVSFTVELDHGGNVTNVTNPYGWD